MKDNVTNPSMNVEDYENMAVQSSNTAKRVAAGAALFVGGAAVAGGAAYAATGTNHPEVTDETETPLTSDDLVDGGNVGNEYQQPEVQEETTTTTTTERVVYVERPTESVHHINVKPEEPKVEWEESTVVYDDEGNVVGSVETGKVQGHKFALMDVDGDNHADYLAIDADGNGRFDDNEIVKYEVSDHVHMGHATAHTREIHYDQYGLTDNDDDNLADNNGKDIIHNDFEDEKTGESYNGDYAENNSDYNSQAGMGQYDESEYLADNETYSSYEEDNTYSASAGENEDYMAANESYDSEEDNTYSASAGENEDYMAADESYVSEEPESNDTLAYEEEEDDSYDSNDYAYTDEDAADDDMMDTGEDALV